jgi:hypothetical protein
VTPQNQEMLEKEGPENPPLNLSDAAVMDLLYGAKKRGLRHQRPNQRVAFLGGGQVRAD